MISLGLRYFWKSRAALDRRRRRRAARGGLGGQPADRQAGGQSWASRCSGVSARHGAQRRRTPAGRLRQRRRAGGRARRHRDPPSRRAGRRDRAAGLHRGFAHRFLPRMAEFKRLRPQARFHPRSSGPRRSAACCWKASQIGLRYTTVHDDRLSTEALCRAPVYAVMCRRHALAGRRSVSVRDLAGCCRCRWATRAPVRQLLFDAACANAGLHIEPAYVSNHSAAFLPMLAGSDIVALSTDRRRPARRAASGRRAIQQSGNAPAQRRRRRCRAHAAGIARSSWTCSGGAWNRDCGPGRGEARAA